MGGFSNIFGQLLTSYPPSKMKVTLHEKKEKKKKKSDSRKNDLVWYMSLNICFQFLNNITRIFIHFFIHTYFQKN